MSVPLPVPFPALTAVDRDRNPAIRLFGKRFFTDQAPLELLAELLTVALCEKCIGGGAVLATPLPAYGDLLAWPAGAPLRYRPPVRLSLKLFAFLSASRLDARHPVHSQHYEVLMKRLEKKVKRSDGDAGEVAGWLEELLRGFQGAGANRAWCAQTFIPATPAFLARETIWGATTAKRDGVAHWTTITNNLSRYFSMNRRDYLARGGEVLYLQVCNALAADRPALEQFVAHLRQAAPSCIAEEEADVPRLHALLTRGLATLSAYSAGLDRLAQTIEDLDPDTKEAVARAQDGEDGWLACEWCPRESWPEGYLFAVELGRVLRARLDPIGRLQMLTIGCALQVLRSLCAQSARYAGLPRTGAPLGYAWVLAPPEGAPPALKQASQRNLQVVQGRIQRALRAERLVENARLDRVPFERLYREADAKYGHKLFLSLGKRLGLIVPHRGPGARFTMTEDILRYLVLALLRPGERCTYESLLRRVYLHHGIAVEGDGLAEATAWSGLPASRGMQPEDGGWLAAGLRAGGFLTDLSDACSVVRNTYGPAHEAAGTEGTA